MLILTKEDIRKVFSMEDAITSAETALKYLSQKKSDDEITIFESVGTAVLDIVAASSIYENAIANKIGSEITL